MVKSPECVSTPSLALADDERLQTLLNASINSQHDIIILAIDPHYNYYFFNEKHRISMKYFYNVDVYQGMNLMTAISIDIDRIHAQENYGKALQGITHTTIQEFGDINVSIFETVYSPLRDNQNTIIGATAYARDITERVHLERQLKANEEEHRLLLEAMNQGIALHDVIWDEAGNPIDYRYIYVNDFYEKMTGLKRENLIGQRVSIVLPQTETYWWDAFAYVARTRQPYRIVNYSKELKKHYSISFYSPKPNQVAGLVDDVTSLYEARQLMMESEQRYKLLAEQSETFVWEIDVHGVFTYISSAVDSVLGYTQHDLVGQRTHSDLYPDEWKTSYQQAMDHYRSDPDHITPIERQLKAKDGHLIWVETFMAAILDDQGHICKYRGSDRNITQRKEKEAEILYINEHDYLTKLYNRRYFDTVLDELIHCDSYPLTVVMGDMNGLKLVNDAFGHAMGDNFLVTIAHHLNDHFATIGTVARIGGDEFAIVFPHWVEHDAKMRVQLCKKAIEAESIVGVHPSISFGFASTNSANFADQLLQHAEDDMYARKLFETTSHRNETIRTIVKTLHEKNPREEAHSHRVSRICIEIGRALAMSEDELKLLENISHLHDIGKIAIDEAILNKPGRLNDTEWDVIKKHPEIGYRILATSTEYDAISLDILSHHERFDGTGYPRGLVGQDIPLRARIIAVADSYDAMISDRPYRKALSHEVAVAELLRCKGTQFDPQIVDIFIHLSAHMIQ